MIPKTFTPARGGKVFGIMEAANSRTLEAMRTGVVVSAGTLRRSA
jgi:hypothetical protein